MILTWTHQPAPDVEGARQYRAADYAVEPRPDTYARTWDAYRGQRHLGTFTSRKQAQARCERDAARRD